MVTSESPARNTDPRLSYRQAVDWLCSLQWMGAKLGLENTRKLAALAGNPQQKLRFIHVAGTNGKGSVCAILESICRASGLRTGLFTSPHLVSFRERIQIDRQPVSETDVAALVETIRHHIATGWPAAKPAAAPVQLPHDFKPNVPAGSEPQDTGPTFFEAVTIMALAHFAKQACDVVIWETGLGGRLDATNIVTPLASVITNIGHDHQQWLGETLAEIAFEKAGIIKRGVPVITGVEQAEALAVIAETALRKEAPLTAVRSADAIAHFPKDCKLPLLGEHQKVNAALAVATLNALRAALPVTDEAVRRGLASVSWPGRLQLVSTGDGRRFLLDGAHNPEGADALCQALRRHFANEPATFILGMLSDKDWPAMCATLAPLSNRICAVPVSSPRSAPAEAVAAACRQANPSARVTACQSLAEALSLTRNSDFTIVTGSLYLIGEAMERLGLQPVADSGERALNDWQGSGAFRSPPAKV